MGTTQTSDQTNKYDPGSMSTFQRLLGAFGPTASSYISNPFGNPFFQTQQQMGTRNAQNQNQTATRGVVQNMTGSGLAGGASNPAGAEMLNNQMRANTANTANQGFLAPVQNALGMQQFFSNLASNFRPLQTGGTQTQSTGGLGTWLPQVAGAGLGIAGAAMGMPGGMGGLFGGGGGGGGGFQPWANLGGPQLGSGPSTGMAGLGSGGWGNASGLGGMSGGGWGNLSGIGGMAPPPPPQ